MTATESIRLARSVSGGNTRIAVPLARYLAYLHATSEPLAIALVLLTLRGDPEARSLWEGLARQGNGDATLVLVMLEEIEGMHSDSVDVAAELIDLEPVSMLSLTTSDETEILEQIPHRPTDTGALPPVALPRVPSPTYTHNRVCAASTHEDLLRRCTTR